MEAVEPELDTDAGQICSATSPMSASGMTIAASLPPSSSVTRSMVSAPAAITRRPAAVDPVNDTLSTSGCAVRP